MGNGTSCPGLIGETQQNIVEPMKLGAAAVHRSKHGHGLQSQAQHASGKPSNPQALPSASGNGFYQQLLALAKFQRRPGFWPSQLTVLVTTFGSANDRYASRCLTPQTRRLAMGQSLSLDVQDILSRRSLSSLVS